MGEEDFANYTCSATNSLGKTDAIVQLRGKSEKIVLEPLVIVNYAYCRF